MNKARSERQHAKARAFERFGLSLTTADLKQIVKTIQKNGARLIERQSLRITAWEVPFNGNKYPVIYDRTRKEIVTFLPPEFEATLPKGESK